jgi:hypothetical protein
VTVLLFLGSINTTIYPICSIYMFTHVQNEHVPLQKVATSVSEYFLSDATIFPFSHISLSTHHYFFIRLRRISLFQLVFLVECIILVYKKGFRFLVKFNSQNHFSLTFCVLELTLTKKVKTKNVKPLLHTKIPCSSRKIS